MKIRIYHIVLCLVLTLLLLAPLFQKGLPHTHDGELHIARLAAYHKAFTDRQFPPRWASDLNFGFGTPLFIFYYPLPGYVGSLVHALGVNLQNTFKILLGASFLLAAVSFYLWVKEIISPRIAIAASLLYGLAPYHFLDLYVRGAIGELFAFIWIPLVFCMIEKIYKKKSFRFFAIGSLAYALLILSHNAFGLVFTGLIVAYCIWKAKTDIKLLSLYATMLVGGLALSAFFWLPALYEQRFTHSDLFLGTKYASYFPTIRQLIYSPWGFGPDVSKPGGLSPQIGPLHILIAVLGGISMMKFKKYKSELLFWMIFLFISLFFSTSYSLPLWRQSRLLQGFEFPWRFTALSTFCIAAMSLFVFQNYNNEKLHLFLSIAILFYSVQFIAVSSYEEKSDSYYTSYAHSTDFGAARTVWAAGDPIAFPSEPIQLISGDAKIIRSTRSSTIHQLTIDARTQSQILDNTLYFPGWQVIIDGETKIPIQFQDQHHRGLITYVIPSGIHEVITSFHESPIRLLSDIISLSTFIAWTMLFGKALIYL